MTVDSATFLKRLEGLHPRVIDLSLDRVYALLSKLGDPHKMLPPVIHVAGTNGKGSVCAFMQAMLQAAGYRVDVFTSPHLQRFHERIKLNGAEISEDKLIDVLQRTEVANAGGEITFFEVTTAAAFLAFAENAADVLILETGLGGRLDATNVVDQPAASVITPISFDHEGFLGDTLREIAAEKAGILKTGCLAVIGPQDGDALSVIENRATRLNVPLSVCGQDWDAYEQHGRLVFQRADELIDLPMPALRGPHQVGNAGTAIATVTQLDGFSVAHEHLAEGLKSVHWPGRMQQLGDGALFDLLGPGYEIWLDGGHNPSAGAVTARTMAELEEQASKPLILIIGMMKNKDAEMYLNQFKGLAREVVAVPVPGTTEGYDPVDLLNLIHEAGFTADMASNVREALSLIASEQDEPARVLICGSLYLAGHVLDLNEEAHAA